MNCRDFPLQISITVRVPSQLLNFFIQEAVLVFYGLGGTRDPTGVFGPSKVQDGIAVVVIDRAGTIQGAIGGIKIRRLSDATAENLLLMRLLDEQYTRTPF